MVKHAQTIRWQKPTNWLSVFDHFVGLTLKDCNALGKICLFRVAVKILDKVRGDCSSVFTADF